MRIVIFLLMFFSAPVYAGVYLDLGITYIDEFNIVQRATINFNDDYLIEAELTSSLKVKAWVGMFRAGYIFENGIAIEYDSIGTPDAYLRRANIFYKLEF